jgi:CRISPR-associated protein Cmr5
MLQTRSQRFASSAFGHVDALKAASGSGKYKAITRNLPVLIRTAGLAQALAFIPSGEEQERMHEALVGQLSETVGADLRAACRNPQLPLEQYMRLTRDTLDALVWYKRFAESLITE